MGEFHRERLKRVGFAAHNSALAIREVLARFPAQDALAARLRALESEASAVAAEALHTIRVAEGDVP